ncbi:hypothetical protein [Polystyrenella longa]|uniref:hypothetical protein n=1 Tax=Polystyrenella longa TaxID=2528007 RepID=UPI001E2A21A1|nr:hypothetical protein [Polystyrenella longa]
MLVEKDFKHFQAGRPKREILEDVQWRGDFIISTEHDEEAVAIISYGLCRESLLTTEVVENTPHEIEESLWAIFVADRFVKFILPPKGDGKQQEVNDFSWYLQSLKFEPVELAAMQKEVMSRPETPSQTDPGLTAAFLILKGAGAVPHQANYEKNRELRNQFNAARLEIGMNMAEVESIFGQEKPLKSGELESGPFRIYGSNESFNTIYPLHFSNILVLYQQGKVSGVYSLNPGADWYQQLQHRFSDLPEK